MEKKLKFNNLKFQQLKLESDLLRGCIIDSLVNIEFFISDFLSDYFSKEGFSDELNKYVFARELSYDSKKNILSNLISNKKVNCFYKEFNGDLQYLQNFRNRIAHCTLYIESEYINSYDGTEIIYSIYELRKYEKGVIVNIKSMEEDVEKLIYSKKSLIAKANRVLASFGNIK